MKPGTCWCGACREGLVCPDDKKAQAAKREAIAEVVAFVRARRTDVSSIIADDIEEKFIIDAIERGEHEVKP